VTRKPGAGALSPSPHDEFLELCALSTAGELTGAEQKRLEEHLAGCRWCAEAKQQYDAVVSKAIPAMAPNPQCVDCDPSWSQDQAEADFFERLTREDELGVKRASVARDSPSKPSVGRVPLSDSQVTWRNVWALCAASVLLAIALGVSAYQVGTRRGVRRAADLSFTIQKNESALEERVSDAGHERELLHFQIEQRDQEISSLRHAVEQKSLEISRLKLAQSQLETDFRNGQAGRQDWLQQRSELTERLEFAQTENQGVRGRLDTLERQATEDQQRTIVLEAKLTDLTRLLHDRETAIEQQQELLAHDRDIRDLMGARDLYVAEVYDVERNGKTKKPYGRVFYTQGKSLIFYAYDLDQQVGVQNASTFQAWGRRGPDRQQALSLGVFYVDSASKRRWVLRSDDPKALAQIDAVFVTVEPKGGSDKPSNKPLLFAYLHMDPNHP